MSLKSWLKYQHGRNVVSIGHVYSLKSGDNRVKHTLLALSLISALSAHAGTLTVKVVNTRPSIKQCQSDMKYLDSISHSQDEDWYSDIASFQGDWVQMCNTMLDDKNADTFGYGTGWDEVLDACTTIRAKECQ